MGFTAVRRGEAAGCLSLGNNWYFRGSGCAILQTCGFLSSDELVETSCIQDVVSEEMAFKDERNLHTESVDAAGETVISILLLAAAYVPFSPSELSMQVTICAMRDLELLGKLLIVVETG